MAALSWRETALKARPLPGVTVAKLGSTTSTKAPLTGAVPVDVSVNEYATVSPGAKTRALPTTALVRVKRGTAVTVKRVGSRGATVPGSSEATATKPAPVTWAWLLTTVPDRVEGFTLTVTRNTTAAAPGLTLSRRGSFTLSNNTLPPAKRPPLTNAT